MKILRSRACASLATLAVAMLTVTPAMAQGWGGPPPPPYRHHPYHGDGGADFLAGLLFLGGVAAIVSAANSSKNTQQTVNSEPVNSPSANSDDRSYVDSVPSASDARPAYPGGPVAGEAGYAAADDEEAHYEARHGTNVSAGFGMAVDTCASEIEGSTSDKVQNVDKVDHLNGRIAVEGHLNDGRPFACSVDQDGHVRSVAIDGHAMN